MDKYDIIIIGSTAGGLIASVFIAHAGRRVCLIDRYCLSMIRDPQYRRWDAGVATELCRRSQSANRGAALLKSLGLDVDWVPRSSATVPCDRFHAPGMAFTNMPGFVHAERQLAGMFPEQRQALREYFCCVDSLDTLATPRADGLAPSVYVMAIPGGERTDVAALSQQDIFDQLRIPADLQGVLAGYALQIGLPPERTSFSASAAVTAAFRSGMCMHACASAAMYGRIADFLRSHDGCHILDGSRLVNLAAVDKRISAALFSDAIGVTSDQTVMFGAFADAEALVDAAPARDACRVDRSATSSCTVDLTLTGVDLATQGFDGGDIWRYPASDINACYHRQVTLGNCNDPALLITAPSTTGATSKSRGRSSRLIASTWCNWSSSKPRGGTASNRTATSSSAWPILFSVYSSPSIFPGYVIFLMPFVLSLLFGMTRVFSASVTAVTGSLLNCARRRHDRAPGGNLNPVAPGPDTLLLTP